MNIKFIEAAQFAILLPGFDLNSIPAQPLNAAISLGRNDAKAGPPPVHSDIAEIDLVQPAPDSRSDDCIQKIQFFRQANFRCKYAN